jgi:hypothetical protein
MTIMGLGIVNGRMNVSAKQRTPSRLLRRYIHALQAVVLTAAFAGTGFAKGPGTTTGELLKIPVNARAIGMGEAFTAAADDSYSLQINPAGMTLASQKEASFMHESLIESIHFEHMGFVAPGDNISFGASMSYLGFGEIAGYNNVGESIGDQKANSYIVTGGLASQVMDGLSLGLAGSFLRETLADTSASTFAGNAGAIYSFQRHPLGGDYRLGASVLNLGPGLKYISERDPLPRKIKLGAAAMHIKEWPMNFTLDLTLPNDNDTFVSLGSEYWFKQLLALRLGYTGSNDEGRGLRLGVGLKMRGLLFDYAYGGFGDFGATHRIGLSLRFGDRIKQYNKEQRAVLREARGYMQSGDYGPAIVKMEEMLQKDPTNDRILAEMVKAHEAMLRTELNEAVAQAHQKEEIPSAEEFALQDLVPGQQNIAQNMMTPVDDPLGLSTLPDINELDAVAPVSQRMAPAPTPAAPALQEAPKPERTTPVEPTTSINADPETPAPSAGSSSDSMIDASDIYGN